CTVAKNLYEWMGEERIEAFVDRLYDVMSTDPEAEYVWKWHPANMDEVKARLRSFMAGWLGGPMTYPELYGPPMMRRRHLPFPIGPKERDIWMKCARTALKETVADERLQEVLDHALSTMADHMRNRDENGQPASGSCGCGGSCGG
ncbi:MAG: group II truncated hemoglobin, partial [Alphaproteobacteria bacterium]